MLRFVKFAPVILLFILLLSVGPPDPAWNFVARHSRLACFITYLIIASLPFVLFLPEISSASFQILSDNTGQSWWISSGIVLFCQLLAPITSRFMLSHPCDASTKFLRPTPDFSCVHERTSVSFMHYSLRGPSVFVESHVLLCCLVRLSHSVPHRTH